jgi:hypothetical protein
MKVKVRQRKDQGRVTWTADIHVTPKGEEAPDRFRLSAPPIVISKSSAERWAGEQARLIATNGRPYSTKKARETRAVKAAALAAAEAAAKAAEAPTFAAFFPKFLEHCTAERRKGSTLETYALVARLHIIPRLGHLALDKISELDVQRVKAGAGGGQAEPRQRRALGPHGHAQAREGSLPDRHHPADQAGEEGWRGDDALLLARGSSGAGWPRSSVIRCAWRPSCSHSMPGCARARVHALRWHDIDEKRNEVNVRHTLYRGDPGLRRRTGSRARVPMTARLLAALRALPRNSEWLLPRGVQTKPGVATRSACTPVSLRFVLASAAKRAGVPDHGPHSLRHTFASLLLAAGGRPPNAAGTPGPRVSLVRHRSIHAPDAGRRSIGGRQARGVRHRGAAPAGDCHRPGTGPEEAMRERPENAAMSSAYGLTRSQNLWFHERPYQKTRQTLTLTRVGPRRGILTSNRSSAPVEQQVLAHDHLRHLPASAALRYLEAPREHNPTTESR